MRLGQPGSASGSSAPVVWCGEAVSAHRQLCSLDQVLVALSLVGAVAGTPIPLTPISSVQGTRADTLRRHTHGVLTHSHQLSPLTPVSSVQGTRADTLRRHTHGVLTHSHQLSPLTPVSSVQGTRADTAATHTRRSHPLSPTLTAHTGL